MELIYVDEYLLVCVKPAGVLSTDEPGGVPELAREALGDPQAEVRTVHRLDRVVSGLMVLARRADAASELSRQIRENILPSSTAARKAEAVPCGIFCCETSRSERPMWSPSLPKASRKPSWTIRC